MKKIVAIDFDDTITIKRPYPEVAPLNKRAKKYITKIHDLGYELVFWSARKGDDHNFAFDRCLYEFELPFIKCDSAEYSRGATGKLEAFFYIDDRSYFGRIPWFRIYKYLKRHK